MTYSEDDPRLNMRPPAPYNQMTWGEIQRAYDLLGYHGSLLPLDEATKEVPPPPDKSQLPPARWLLRPNRRRSQP